MESSIEVKVEFKKKNQNLQSRNKRKVSAVGI